MAKFRVYEIAKKYNKDNKEILEILKANHVEVKNHMSTIGDEQIKMIDNALKPKKKQNRITIQRNRKIQREKIIKKHRIWKRKIIKKHKK